jgi:TonB family protein
LLRIDHLHQRADFAVSFPSSPDLPAPRFVLEATGKLKEFFSSLKALVRGPAAPRKFLGGAYFRDCWIEQGFPKYAFAAATILQLLLVLFPPPIWNIRPANTVSAAARTQLTWYGPAKDFPAILPAIHPSRPPARKETPKAPARRASDAFHPRQTILSEPLHPTHPRQTLVQPRAPLEPPKILPVLPNIVQLADSQPVRPKLQLTAKELSSLKPKARVSLSATNVDAPEILAQEKQAGTINITAATKAPAKPLLPVNPMSAPHSAAQKTETNTAAPEIGGHAGDSETLIALSATPAPVAPPPAIPSGNLSARVSISPDGRNPGKPNGSAPVTGPPGRSTSAGGRGPEGIFISGGSTENSSPASGLGNGPASHEAGNALAVRPIPRERVAPEGSRSLSAAAVAAAQTAPKLGMSPQEALGSKRLYTLHVNMPNLTSASGSWILNFAELNESELGGAINSVSADLTGPVPLRKVDPKYPPEFRTSHVEGEVLLYAIIRKDGSVDSIQLLHSVDPRLDANAMEALAQWKFHPAEKRGEPVDLEAVVHIPFRSSGPGF